MILKLNILIFTFVCAYMDLKMWKVKNLWLLLNAALALAIRIFWIGDLLSGLLGMVIPTVLLMWFYLIRKMGAGDVKLFAVAGLYLGKDAILTFLLFSMISGAVWFLILSVRAGGIRNVLGKRIHVAVCAFASAVCWIGGITG